MTLWASTASAQVEPSCTRCAQLAQRPAQPPTRERRSTRADANRMATPWRMRIAGDRAPGTRVPAPRRTAASRIAPGPPRTTPYANSMRPSPQRPDASDVQVLRALTLEAAGPEDAARAFRRRGSRIAATPSRRTMLRRAPTRARPTASGRARSWRTPTARTRSPPRGRRPSVPRSRRDSRQPVAHTGCRRRETRRRRSHCSRPDDSRGGRRAEATGPSSAGRRRRRLPLALPARDNRTSGGEAAVGARRIISGRARQAPCSGAARSTSAIARLAQVEGDLSAADRRTYAEPSVSIRTIRTSTRSSPRPCLRRAVSRMRSAS